MPSFIICQPQLYPIIYNNPLLIGGFNISEKMSSSVGMFFSNIIMESHKSHVPNISKPPTSLDPTLKSRHPQLYSYTITIKNQIPLNPMVFLIISNNPGSIMPYNQSPKAMQSRQGTWHSAALWRSPQGSAAVPLPPRAAAPPPALGSPGRHGEDMAKTWRRHGKQTWKHRDK